MRIYEHNSFDHRAPAGRQLQDQFDEFLVNLQPEDDLTTLSVTGHPPVFEDEPGKFVPADPEWFEDEAHGWSRRARASMASST